jgi:hypothetical protein
MIAGELLKMHIYAYNDPELSDSHQVDEPFIAMINPETYAIETKMEFRQGQGQGTTGTQQPFELKPPEEMAFEFLFDNTGIIDGNQRDDLSEEIATFTELLMGYDSETHEPKFFKLVWGTLLFKGRCIGLLVTYKLFNPDGSPIRAICKVTFREFKEENLRVAEENAQSPDLTHHRIVKKGDTLPLMCYNIYGDSRYYIQVARVNKLNNFRSLKTGDEIFFPPITKAAN